MNRPLPRGDCRRRSPDPGWESGPSGLVPGPGRLVGGVAAATSGPRIGYRCATVGPRSLRQHRLGVSAKAATARAPGAQESKPTKKARRAEAGRARKGG
jgi:hypothetical protein